MLLLQCAFGATRSDAASQDLETCTSLGYFGTLPGSAAALGPSTGAREYGKRAQGCGTSPPRALLHSEAISLPHLRCRVEASSHTAASQLVTSSETTTNTLTRLQLQERVPSANELGLKALQCAGREESTCRSGSGPQLCKRTRSACQKPPTLGMSVSQCNRL